MLFYIFQQRCGKQNTGSKFMSGSWLDANGKKLIEILLSNSLKILKSTYAKVSDQSHQSFPEKAE